MFANDAYSGTVRCFYGPVTVDIRIRWDDYVTAYALAWPD